MEETNLEEVEGVGQRRFGGGVEGPFHCGMGHVVGMASYGRILGVGGKNCTSIRGEEEREE